MASTQDEDEVSVSAWKEESFQPVFADTESAQWPEDLNLQFFVDEEVVVGDKVFDGKEG